MDIPVSRRSFLKTGAAVIGTVAVGGCKSLERMLSRGQTRPAVFMTKDISSKGLLKIYSSSRQGASCRGRWPSNSTPANRVVTISPIRR